MSKPASHYYEPRPASAVRTPTGLEQHEESWAMVAVYGLALLTIGGALGMIVAALVWGIVS